MGGYTRALELVRELAGLPEDARLQLKTFLPRGGLFGGWRKEESSESAALAPLAVWIRRLGLAERLGPLAMPPFELSTDAVRPTPDAPGRRAAG